jgi:hypothetical protein
MGCNPHEAIRLASPGIISSLGRVWNNRICSIPSDWKGFRPSGFLKLELYGAHFYWKFRKSWFKVSKNHKKNQHVARDASHKCVKFQFKRYYTLGCTKLKNYRSSIMNSTHQTLKICQNLSFLCRPKTSKFVFSFFLKLKNIVLNFWKKKQAPWSSSFKESFQFQRFYTNLI